MSNYITLLSDLSYELGIIGLAEYKERLAVAQWLMESGAGGADPREPSLDSAGERSERSEAPDDAGGSNRGPRSSNSPDASDEDDPVVEFMALGTWVFTVGDPDCYPSVPHGHFQSKSNPWPKLNPYVGRVFSNMHQEDPRRRLSRSEMKALWRDADFIAHCTEQIDWYSTFAPRYPYPNARRGKLKFPRW